MYATFVILKGPVRSTVYATFVILKGPVRSTGAFLINILTVAYTTTNTVERTDPYRMTKVDYTVDWTVDYAVTYSATYTV